MPTAPRGIARAAGGFRGGHARPAGRALAGQQRGDAAPRGTAAVRADWVRAGHHGLRQRARLPGARHRALGPAADDDAALAAHRRRSSCAPATASATAAASAPTRPMRIGVAACGYADGYPRLAADRHAGAGRRRAQPTGRPRLDGHGHGRPDAGARRPAWAARSRCGARARQGSVLPIDEVAHAAGTVGYELMCALAQRVPVRVV